MDWFSFSFWSDFWQQHALWLMFASAFLSATILPGNSEVVFITLAIPKLTLSSVFGDVSLLILIATLGNGLGSMTTFYLGSRLPKLDSEKPRVLWVMDKLKRYGAVALLLSWLPIVGDVFCAVAGWLRLNLITSSFFIFLGKFFRYIALLFISTPFLL